MMLFNKKLILQDNCIPWKKSKKYFHIVQIARKIYNS